MVLLSCDWQDEEKEEQWWRLLEVEVLHEGEVSFRVIKKVITEWWRQRRGKEINHFKNILIFDFQKLPFDINCIINVLSICFQDHFSVYLLHNPWFGVEEGRSSLGTWVWMILDGPNSLWHIFMIHIPHPQGTLHCDSQSSLKCLSCWSGTQVPAGLCDSGLHIRPCARSVPSQREAFVKAISSVRDLF